MSALGGLARFTPSVLDQETLEALFVHRESLVEDAVDRIRRASTSKERASRLFVGPRGAGKTHLVSLIAHRARALPGFGESFQLAWLPEDLWAIGDFEDLRKEILKCIEPAEPLADAEAMDGGPREFAGRVTERGPIVVIIENLDHVLQDLGPDGQRKLRAAIESDRSMLLIATATRLTAHLLDQTEPFYGFFDTFDLEQFDVDEAADMLKAIARQRGDQALVDELDKPQARARLAAVAHLAGGQPRIWALFGAGLTVEGLDDLVSVLIERFDDLTPYYQEQLRRLSVNERKAVQALAEADRALPIKDLAELTGIKERSLSSTMGDLRKAGWVKVKTGPLIDLVDKRLTYYELAEPLARLAFQLKAAHGEPVRLVVDFLRTWFEPDALLEASVEGLAASYVVASRVGGDGGAAASLCRWLLSVERDLGIGLRVAQDGGLLLALDEGLRVLEDGNPEPLLALPGSVLGVLEDRLSTSTVAELRVAVHLRAVVGGAGGMWSQRAVEALAAASPEEASLWMPIVAVWLAIAGDEDGARSLLQDAADQWNEMDEAPRTVRLLVGMCPFVFEVLRSRDLPVSWLECLGAAADPELRLRAVISIATITLWCGSPVELAHAIARFMGVERQHPTEAPSLVALLIVDTWIREPLREGSLSFEIQGKPQVIVRWRAGGGKDIIASWRSIVADQSARGFSEDHVAAWSEALDVIEESWLGSGEVNAVL